MFEVSLLHLCQNSMKKLMMKEKIIGKSRELFLKLGFKSITMDDIAQEMCCSKKTIYKFKPLFIMKKLVFTALAMVAFSGIAMANSTEVKEGKKEKFKKEVVLKADS